MAETIQYKCPCCGGRLEFDSGLQKMKCPYCDTCLLYTSDAADE